MTVAELIEKLQKLPLDVDVTIWGFEDIAEVEYVEEDKRVEIRD